jgi:BirA family transcriptional regulator, biotin operon repressor / biotin---[acetyl-CoA-carboxylase] ligase
MTNDLQLPDGFSLVAYDHIDSTNEEAKRLALDHAPHGTIVLARSQEAGRGRRGRKWVSKPGNLFCSFIVRPDCPLSEAAQLSFVMAISVANSLVKTLSKNGATPIIQCKWPNDILIDGKKVAGILLETASGSQSNLEGVIAGIGINLQHFPAQTEFPATSLSDHGAVNVTVPAVLEIVCDLFAKWYVIWQTEGFQTIRSAWLDKAYGLGSPVSARLASETISGLFETLDPQGAMIVDDNGSRRHIAAGDVYFDETILQHAV